MPWTAAQQPARGEPTAVEQSVHGQRFDRVGATARVEPAGRRQQRRDDLSIYVYRPQQQPGGRTRPCWSAVVMRIRHPGPPPLSGTRHRTAGLHHAQLAECRIKIRPELTARCVRSRGECADHHQCASGQQRKTVAHQVPEPPGHAMPEHRVAHGFAHDKTHAGRFAGIPSGFDVRVRPGVTRGRHCRLRARAARSRPRVRGLEGTARVGLRTCYLIRVAHRRIPAIST